MIKKEKEPLTAGSLVERASKYLAAQLNGRKFSIDDLNRAVEFHLGKGVDPDLEPMEKQIWDLAVLSRDLELTPTEFGTLFGRELDELLFESCVDVLEKGVPGTNIIIQLFHRNYEQVKDAHRLLCIKGVRLDAIIPESSSAGGYWATSTVLFSATI